MRFDRLITRSILKSDYNDLSIFTTHYVLQIGVESLSCRGSQSAFKNGTWISQERKLPYILVRFIVRLFNQGRNRIKISGDSHQRRMSSQIRNLHSFRTHRRSTNFSHGCSLESICLFLLSLPNLYLFWRTSLFVWRSNLSAIWLKLAMVYKLSGCRTHISVNKAPFRNSISWQCYWQQDAYKCFFRLQKFNLDHHRVVDLFLSLINAYR